MTEVAATTPARPSTRRPVRLPTLPAPDEVPVLVGFPPGTRLSAHATWFSGDGDLVAVVDAGRPAAAHDAVLADALAWQGDSRLVLVVPAEDAWSYAARTAWVRTPVAVMAARPDGVAPELVACTREEVVSEQAGRPPAARPDLGLAAGHQDWVSDLLRHEALDATTAVPHGGGVTWMREGLEVLRLTSRGDGLVVAPGLRLRSRTDPRRRPLVLRGPLTDDELDDVVAVVQQDLRAHQRGVARTGGPDDATRLAADVARHPSVVGLEAAERAVTGPERPVDLLGHADGALHVAVVAVGGDAAVVLRGLDHVAWATAHRQALAADRGWPLDPDAPVHLDLVLAAPDRVRARVPAVGGHVAPHVEALAEDLPVVVHVVHGFGEAFDGTEVPDVRPLALADLWVPRGGLVARPLRPRRGTPPIG